MGHKAFGNALLTPLHTAVDLPTVKATFTGSLLETRLSLLPKDSLHLPKVLEPASLQYEHPQHTLGPQTVLPPMYVNRSHLGGTTAVSQ